MFEKKSEESIAINPELLVWIHHRVMETTERGSIYIAIEKQKITSIHYERNHRFTPTSENSGPKGSGVSLN